jgi:hypothetical protein
MDYADLADGRRLGLWRFGLRFGLPATRLVWSGCARWPCRAAARRVALDAMDGLARCLVALRWRAAAAPSYGLAADA